MYMERRMETDEQARPRALDALVRFLRAIWLAAVLVIGLLTLISVLSQRPAHGADLQRAATPARSDGIARAVAEADRLTARFDETLDFDPLLDEFFLGDAIDRNRRAGFFASHLDVDPALVEQLDERSLRRAYSALMGALHLQSAHTLGSVRLDTEEEDEASIPEEVERRLEAIEERGPIDTHEEFFEMVTELEEVVRLYRARVTPATVASPLYAANRETMASWDRRTAVETSDAESGYLEYGVPEGTEVYEVFSGVFWYSFVETPGGLKVVAVGIVE